MNRLHRLFVPLATAVGLASLALLSLFAFLTPAVAQTEEIFVQKQLGRDNPVVHVGEYLTFTIYIENRSSFTVTTLPLSDTFNVAVLAFVDATPMPDAVDGANGRLDWTDLTTTFGDLAPGDSVWVVVGFIAEHPAPVVVNRAEVHDALFSNGQIGGGDDDSEEGESIGGSSPVDKSMIGDQLPEIGQPLTFTIRITNDGYTTMTMVPLLESYDPAYLQFSTAVPQPETIDEIAGELYWSDLTSWFGDVGPFASIQITAVFTALAPIDVTTNHASVVGASDWYGNEMESGADDVPITIIDSSQPATATPTAVTATATSVSATPQPSTPEAATATPQATATAVRPQTLPATGLPPTKTGPNLWMLLFAGLLPIGLWLLWRRYGPGWRP